MATKPAVKKISKAPATEGEFAMAAADICKALTVNPPLEASLGEEALSKEIEALLPDIKEGDDLTPATWKTLKKLGWKDTKPAKAAAPVKASKADKTPKAPKEPKGPGVISTILEVLQKGKPVTKEAILAVLVKRFPDRSQESMGKTVNVQVPNRIAKEHKVKVEKTDKGYVIR
jgi:hypothetical protein